MALVPLNIVAGEFSDAPNNYRVGVAVQVKTTGGAFASIYADAAGSTAIPQDGSSNITDSTGSFSCFVNDGVYDVTILSVTKRIAAGMDSSKSRRTTTVSEIDSGVFSVGDLLEVSDRANAKFNVVSGGTANGYDILGAGSGKTAVLSSEMTYYSLGMFGAKLDGTTYDDAAVAAALSSGYQILQHGGVCRINGASTIDITADCKFTGGFKFLLDTQPAGYVFDVVPEYTPIVLNQGDVTLAQFAKYANTVSSLSAYPYHFATIKSTQQDLIRLGGKVLTKGSVTVVGEGGKLVYPLTATFGSIQSITLTPINIPVRTIEGLAIEVTGAVNTASLIKQSRNNVKFVSPIYIQGSTSQSIPVRNFIVASGVYGCEIIDPICEQLSSGRIDYNYVVNAEYSAFIRISGMQSWEGWAQVDGNYCRDMSIEKSTVYRVGGHWNFWDIALKDSTVVGQEAVASSGGGEMLITNIVMMPNAITSGPFAAAVIREDYGAEWDGVITVDGVVIDIRGLDTAKEVNGVNAYISSSLSAHDFGRDLILPRDINVRNVTLMTNKSGVAELDFLGVRVGSALSSLTGGRKIHYPRSIDVYDLDLADSNVAKNNEVNAAYLSGSVQSATVATMTVTVRDINRRDPRDAALNPYDGGQLPSFSFPSVSDLTINVECSDCKWLRADYSASGRCEIKNSLIASIAGSGRYELYENQYAASSFSGAWIGSVHGGVIRAYLATDAAYKQVGFPNNIETNWAYCKNMAVEVNGAIRSVTQTTSTIQTGFVNATYYIAP